MGPELLDNLEILETMEELDLMVNVENREGTGEKDNLEMQVGVVLEELRVLRKMLPSRRGCSRWKMVLFQSRLNHPYAFRRDAPLGGTGEGAGFA